MPAENHLGIQETEEAGLSEKLFTPARLRPLIDSSVPRRCHPRYVLHNSSSTDGKA
jgi:hypothetical protein